MTFHWKAVEEHVLMVPLVVQPFNHFGGKNAFSEFFSKKPQPLKRVQQYSNEFSG
jgi:hypothetical protein